MFDLKSISQEYVAKLQEYEKTQANYRRLRDKYERLAKKYQTLEYKQKYPHWKGNYLAPIAEELIKQFPDSHYDIAGPFGLSNETSISIENQNNILLAFLEFVHGDLDKGEFFLRDYKTDTHAFSKGTIGEVNGMNHPNIPIPQDATIEWFLDKINYFRTEVEKWESAQVKL